MANTCYRGYLKFNQATRFPKGAAFSDEDDAARDNAEFSRVGRTRLWESNRVIPRNAI